MGGVEIGESSFEARRPGRHRAAPTPLESAPDLTVLYMVARQSLRDAQDTAGHADVASAQGQVDFVGSLLTRTTSTTEQHFIKGALDHALKLEVVLEKRGASRPAAAAARLLGSPVPELLAANHRPRRGRGR
jgi:hypothetical protein